MQSYDTNVVSINNSPKTESFPGKQKARGDPIPDCPPDPDHEVTLTSYLRRHMACGQIGQV